jgi:DNA replication protein DnaC
LLNNLLKLFEGSKDEEEILSNKATTFKVKIKQLEEKLLIHNCWSEEQTAGFKSIKELKDIEDLDTNLAGCEEEEKVFVKLQSTLEKSNVKDTVVISGWNVNTKGQKSCEFDFLIVSEPLKTIFQMEVKRTHTQKSRKSAREQLQKGKQLFESKVIFPNKENWKYVKVMFFALNEQKEDFKSSDFHFCQNCQSYILGPETDFSAWWEDMTFYLSILESQSSSTTLNRNIYTKTVQFLTHQMYIQGNCFTNQNLLDYTEEKIEKISTPEKLFFWSKTQFPLLHDSRKKRMVFTSHFGTGKTVLLRAKAKQLIEKGEKIVFIFFGSTDSYSLLRTTLQEEFGNSHQVKIMTWKCKGSDEFLFIEYFFKLGFTIFIVFSWINLSKQNVSKLN